MLAAGTNLGIGLGTRTRVSQNAMKKHPLLAVRPSHFMGEVCLRSKTFRGA
jgi:hypothetical protein